MIVAAIPIPVHLNAKTVRALADKLNEAPPIPLVLTGSSEIFCHGIDLEYFLESNDKEIQITSDLFCQCLNAIHQHTAPTIACVEGNVLGGGLGVLAACDIVIANEGAEFGLPELLYGFVPGFILPYLLERLSKQSIRRLAFTGTSLNAMTAKDIGLVDEIFYGDAQRVIKQWGRKLARTDRDAVRVLRSLLDGAPNPTDKKWREHCSACSTEMQMNIEKRDALRFFFDEGVPPWENRS